MAPATFRAHRALIALVLVTACAQRSPAAELLPTRVVPPGALAAAASRETTPVPGATAAALPAPPSPAPTRTPRPLAAGAVTGATVADLKPAVSTSNAIPQHIISVGTERALVLQPREFVSLALSDLSIASRMPFSVPADAEVYWYAGSSDTRRAAILLPDGALSVFDMTASRVLTTLRVTPPISVAVSDIALSPDGKEVLYVNGTLQRIDVASGRATAVGTSLPTGTFALHLAEDATRLTALTAANQLVVVPGVGGRATLTITPGFTVDPASVRMAPDGGWLSVSSDSDRVIWKLEPAAVGAAHTITGAASSTPEFDPRGAHATFTDPQGLALYDLKAHEVVDVFMFDTGAAPRSAHFTPDGSAVVVASASGVATFDLATSKATAQADRTATTSVSLSPDGKVAATFSQFAPFAGLDLVDTATGRQIRRLMPVSPPRQATFSPSGTYVAGVLIDGTIQVWRTADGSLAQQIEPPPGRTGSPLCFTSDEREILRLSGDTVEARELGGGARRTFKLPFIPTLVGGCSETGSIVVSDGKDVVLLSGHGETLADIPLDAPATGGARLIISPDGRFAALATRAALQVFSLEAQSRVVNVPLTAQPSSVGFNPLSNRLALVFPGAAGSRVDVLDLAGGARQAIDLPAGYTVYAFFLPDPDLIASVTFVPKPKVAIPRSVFDFGATEITFHRIDSGKPLRTLAFDAPVSGVDLSANGTVLGTGGVDGSLTFWSVAK